MSTTSFRLIADQLRRFKNLLFKTSEEETHLRFFIRKAKSRELSYISDCFNVDYTNNLKIKRIPFLGKLPISSFCILKISHSEDFYEYVT